jgi:hypothetical protein
MASPYRNRQFAWIYLIPLIVLVPFVVVMTSVENAWWVGLLLAMVLAFVYGMFATLSTRVERGEFHAHFTYGWPRRTIPISAIQSHEPARGKWWHGWGIRFIPGGMLYSVWGLDTIEIRYRDAKKGKDRMFRIGTDDTEGLDAALTAARANRT